MVAALSGLVQDLQRLANAHWFADCLPGRWPIMASLRMRRMKAVAASVVCVLAVAVVPAQESTQPPVFRGSVDLVQVDVYVTDEDGTPVSGLTAGDFEVFENGYRRQIVAFSPVEIPVIAREPVWSDAESDVGTNVGHEGRTYLIYLGAVSGEMALRARQRLRVFMDRYFGENDIAAVVTGHGLVTDGQDFTNNRRLIMTAIDKFAGGGHGDRYLQDFRERLEMFARMPNQRKVMLWVTSSIPFDSYDVIDYHGGVLGLLQENAHAAMSAVTRDAIRIFPFDPAGLSNELGGEAGIRDLENRLNFRGLAELTGGFSFYGSNDYVEAFDRLIRETGTYYVLGFEPQVQAKQGRFVRFDVKAKRPGLTVTSRAGYVEQLEYTRRTTRPEPKRTPAAAALANPASVGGLPIRVHAAAFQGSGKDATVALTAHIDASALEFTESNGRFLTNVEFRHIAHDAKNNIYPEFRHSAALMLSEQEYTRARTNGLSLLSHLELPKGRHQVRVALASGNRSGSVVHDVEVPGFRDDPLTMSGVALTSTAANRVVTLQANARGGKSSRCKPPQCSGDVRSGSSLTLWNPGAPEAGALAWSSSLPSPPTTIREFPSGDTLTAYVEVYDNNKRVSSDQPYVVDATVTLRGMDNVVVRTATDRRVSRDAGRAPGRHAFTIPLTLGDVAPGAYVLDIEARVARPSVEPVRRRIPIRVTTEDVSGS
jgi:VWFA-related protein